jgi:dCMP deaminase
MVMTKRPSLDEYFLGFARHAGTRSTCDRGKVGAVIVKDNQVISTGYAGAARDLPHCDETGHLIREVKYEDNSIHQHCMRTAHAETNAIVQAAKHGVAVNGSTLYCKMEPCLNCCVNIINAGIKRVVAEYRYHGADLTREWFAKAGVQLDVINDEEAEYSKVSIDEIFPSVPAPIVTCTCGYCRAVSPAWLEEVYCPKCKKFLTIAEKQGDTIIFHSPSETKQLRLEDKICIHCGLGFAIEKDYEGNPIHEGCQKEQHELYMKSKDCTCNGGWIYHQHPAKPPKPPGVIIQSLPCETCNPEGKIPNPLENQEAEITYSDDKTEV